MKKFIILILLCITSLKLSAQTYYYRSFQFAYASIYQGNYLWSEWQTSNVNIYIDFTNNKVIIYSPTTQYYRIIYSGNWYYGNQGDKKYDMKFIDGDGDRGTMTLRIESNGNSQLYIRFNNVAWVYNLVRTS